MGASFLITLREGLEISIVLAILIGYLVKTDRRHQLHAVWLGTGVAAVACLIAGIAVHSVTDTLEGKAEQAVEGSLALCAAIVLTYMILWMRKNARTMGGHLRDKVDGATSVAAVATVAFVGVAREGFETVLFLLGAETGSASGAEVVIGGLLGLALSAVAGVLIYLGGSRIDLRSFFRYTGLLLILFAAGLVGKAFHEFRELLGFESGWLIAPMWTIESGTFAAGTTFDFLKGLFGWSADPERIRVLTYFAYALPVLWLFLRPYPSSTTTDRPAARRYAGGATPRAYEMGPEAMTGDEPTNESMQQEIDFRALIGAIPDPVIVVDAAVNLKYVNAAGVEFLGWDPKDWIGRPMFDMIHPDDVPVVVSSMGTVQGKRAGTPVEIRARMADGGWKWVEFVGSDAHLVAGVEGVVVVVRDITQRRMWEVAGGDTAVFQHLVQHGSSVMLLLDADGRVTSVNAAFNRLLGHDPSLTIDRTLASFCAPGQDHLLHSALQRSRDLHLPTAVELEMRHVDPDSPPRPLRFEIVNMLDDPVVGGFIVTGHDVSDLHRARQSLEHIARHDALTGLANRSVLLERLDDVVAAHEPAAAVFIDLDRFKPVNDLFGHEAGDELLRQVADRLRLMVRADDLVARVGGDEFVVLVVGVDDRAVAQAFCDRIDAALAEPYLLAEGPARVTASVGLSLTAGDSAVTGLLADADLAMYEAKAERRGEPISRDPLRRRTANERRQLADDLALGLQRGEIVAHLQPIVSLIDGRTTAVEALARWNHPRLGVLGPLAFLALAEDAGLDLLLGDAVLRSACTAVAALPRAIGLGINLSVAQLADRDLRGRIALILEQAGVPPQQLTVEITERDTLARRAGGGRVAPERTLLELHQLGASLALDDFGTGYSSLTHIRRFPLRTLKIDRAFVAGAADHAEDRAVIAAMVGMAAALGLSVVGEGVERFDQFDMLRTLGCDMAQGFLISMPLAADELQHWMRHHGDDFRSAITNGDTPGSDRARRTRGA